MNKKNASSESHVKLTWLTDGFSHLDKAWTITNTVTGVVEESQSIGDLQNNTPHENDYCVPKSNCHEFAVVDDYGDGLLAGSLVLTVDKVDILSIDSSNDGSWTEKKVTFGSCNPSMTPPTSTPVVSPPSTVQIKNSASGKWCMTVKGGYNGAKALIKKCSSTNLLQKFIVST